MSAATPEFSISADADALAHEAARRFVAAARAASAARGRFAVALSGGSTPKALFALLAAAPYRDRIAWGNVQIFWGDERCVPPTDEQSNYRMTRETLLDRVALPAAQIHRIPAEDPDPARAARAYTAVLEQLFTLGEGEFPTFDLIHLGLGPEGHTASLFPGSPALKEERALVAAPYVEKLGAHRITLTPLVINAAREVQFLVAGAGKAEIVGRVLHDPYDPDELPAQIVAPSPGRLVWLLDEAAAAEL